MNNTQQKENNFMIPLAIIIAGGLVAGAVFFGSGGNTSKVANNQGSQQGVQQQADSTGKIDPIVKEDHIRGNPDAPVKIVEYSDFECPFCKRFHSTMNRVMDEYGKDGQVAWIYRHFPLDQLHPKNARRVAIVSECVNEIAGNNAFWQFADGFFAVTPSNDRTNLTVVLPKIYSDIGVNQSKVGACVSSGKYDKHVQDDIDNAIITGGQGTPWSVVVAPNGETFPLSGAQPYSSVKQLIDIALKAK